MRYGRAFAITVDGVTKSRIFEFQYQVRDFGISRIPIVTDTHEIHAEGVAESAGWFWEMYPVELHDRLDAEMIRHHDQATGFTVRRAG